MVSRRRLLRDTSLCGGVLVSGLHKLQAGGLWRTQNLTTFREGKLLGVLPFTDERNPPMRQAIGAELDGRLFTDLSELTPDKPVTPAKDVYIRTRASRLLDTKLPWIIQIGGLVEKPTTHSAEALQKMTRSMGVHLMECAGNTRAAHFGMLSVAEWDGVLLRDILERCKLQSNAARVLISGFDQYATESRTSIPGASWIFTLEQLNSAVAFLATKMNGEPLTLDHGAPARLIVPGWYGCACIKWVNEIQFVPGDSPATSQMQEYAGRTMQTGNPAAAADYRPALIDFAAMPIRVEKWSIGGKMIYRVVGIQWGGSRAIDGLRIRFNAEEEYSSVDEFRPSDGNTWSFWSHTWTPRSPGKYVISLRLKDSAIITRRLDSGYYNRSVQIIAI
jgi:DMSO/TMAO reductase YedYZ molybdopterin-dependent catalytic subunit